MACTGYAALQQSDQCTPTTEVTPTTVQLGDGKTCSFWMDVWYGEEPLADIYPAIHGHCMKKEISVEEMMRLGLQQTLATRLFMNAANQFQEVQGIIAEKQLSEEPDRRLSVFSKGESGIDSAAIYKLLKARGQPDNVRSAFIWRNSALARVRLFMWLLVNRRIQCRTVLQRKHVLQGATCEVCNGEDETPEHIIGRCTLAKMFWEKIDMPYMQDIDASNLHTVRPPTGMQREEFAAFMALSCWQLWKARNAKIFRNESPELEPSNGYIDFQTKRNM